MTSVTEGGLLNGKIRYRQLATGHRSGFEPVLLAASVAARPAEQVLEAGCGAGAGLLCLGHRVPGIGGLGVEIAPEVAALAAENFKINRLDGVSCLCADIGAAEIGAGLGFDHVMANPPWHGQSSTRSADRLRALAHHADRSVLAVWVEKLAGHLRMRGSLTLILPAACLAEAAACLHANGCGAVTVFPLWPRAGKPAKMLIISATKNANGPDRLLPGLILHDEAGITPAAQAILRDGEAIDFKS